MGGVDEGLDWRTAGDMGGGGLLRANPGTTPPGPPGAGVLSSPSGLLMVMSDPLTEMSPDDPVVGAVVDALGVAVCADVWSD